MASRSHQIQILRMAHQEVDVQLGPKKTTESYRMKQATMESPYKQP